MGDVYKAEDTRLKRVVALKFLSRDVTGTGEHAERFLREAQAAAALDHPNICTIHEIDKQDGEMFLAMAYLDGVPLDERIQQGPLPLASVCEIAKQAAEGLAAAHAAGVVHRDIKSSNIMVSEDRAGRPVVTLMDFGLAQVSGASKLTKVDTRMGTVAYMSPEQSAGEQVGPASDLWSLGVVIYEMVTGELPFKGHYDQAILYSILHEAPSPLTSLRSRVPMELEWIVEKCLAKAPEERYQDAGELVVDLEMLARRASSGRTTFQQIGPSEGIDSGIRRDARGIAGGPWPPVHALLRSKVALAVLLGALGLAFVVGLALAGRNDEPAATTRRFTLRPVETIQGSQRIGHLAISPDGRNLAFSTSGSDGSLWLQPLDRHDPIQVEGTKGARDVFWSPDSNFIGFLTNRGVGKVALRGLTVTMLAEDVNFARASAAWSADGQSIVFTSLGGRTMVVSALGGVARPLQSSVPRRRSVISSPSLVGVGDGEQVLLYAEHTLEGDAVMAGRLTTEGELGEAVRLVEGASPAYSQSGHILFRPSVNNTALWAVNFSPDALELGGQPFLVAQNGSEPSVSSDGTLVYLDNPFTGQLRLVWVDSRGEAVGQIGKEQAWILGPRVSPSGDRVLVSGGRGRNADLWVHEAQRPVLSRLTFDDLEETGAIWAPDSRQVAFMQRGSPDLMLMTVGAGTPARTIYTSEGGPIEPLDWSRDGRYILLQIRSWPGQRPPGGQAAPKKAQGFQGSTGIAYLEREGADGAWVPRDFLPAGRFVVDDAVFSPDGRFVAYESNESDNFEVYVKPFPSGEQRWQVTTEGGRLARWSEDGNELYFIRGDTLFAVALETAGGFSTAEARPLFAKDSLVGFRRHATYDVGPGNRFALVEHAQNAGPPSIRIVLNWLSEFQTL